MQEAENTSITLPEPSPEGSGIDVADKLASLQGLVDDAQQNLEEALSENTRRAYDSQWRKFAAWCLAMGLPSMPADEKTVLVYLTDLAKRSALSTLTQAYAAIREQHRMADLEPPRLDGKLYRSWTGARKKASRERVVVKAKALLPPELKAALGACGGDLGLRDRALLLIGWCAALRRDELASLNVSDLRVEEGGLRVLIRRSKTDQSGLGQEVGVVRSKNPSSCPVAAWEAYLATRSTPSLPVQPEEPAFPTKSMLRMDGGDITRVLLRSLRRAGVPTEGYSAHSLRAGCITAAAQAGHSLEAIQRQSRHKSLEVLLGYVRTANLLTDNVTEGLL